MVLADEYQQLIKLMTADGTLSPLNQESYPNCYLHLSDQSDVARVEHLTFVCTDTAEDAGPNNNWRDPDEMRTELGQIEAAFNRLLTNELAEFNTMMTSRGIVGVIATDQ